MSHTSLQLDRMAAGLLLGCIFLLAGQPGCSAIGLYRSDEMSRAVAQASAQGAAEASTASLTPPVTVELNGSIGQPKIVQIPWQEALTVQNTMAAAKVERQFRRFKLQLVRRQGNSPPLRMDVRYDRSADRVEPAFDYAMHPGDRLVVTQDMSTVIDDMLSPLTGALGAMSH